MTVRVVLTRSVAQYAHVYVEAESQEQAESRVESTLHDVAGWERLACRLNWEDGDVEEFANVLDSEVEDDDYPGIDAAWLDPVCGTCGKTYEAEKVQEYEPGHASCPHCGTDL